MKRRPPRYALSYSLEELAEIRARVAALEVELAQSSEAARRAEFERDALLSSFSWRILAPLRHVVDAVRRRPIVVPQQSEPSTLPLGIDYARWLRDYMILSEADRIAIGDHLTRLTSHPLISVVITGGHDGERLRKITLTSLQAQLYPHWEICPETRAVANGGVAGALQAALAQAKGEFVAIMSPGDRLAEEALYEVAAALSDQPNLDLLYTDEDCIDENGRQFAPAFKAAWNIDLLLGQNMIGRLAIFRRSLLERAIKTDGLRDDAGEHDLALKIAAGTTAARVRHIPSVLYHRYTASREERPLFDSTKPPGWTKPEPAAVHSYLADAAEIVTWAGDPPQLQVRWTLPDPPPRVSLIVPTRDNAALLARCVAGLLYRTDYPDVEMIVVDNDSQDSEALRVLAQLRQDRRVKILPYRDVFNYAAINNMAVGEASGDVVVLINDDIDVIDGAWLREMVSLALRPDIGAVGAKLLYGDGRIQHAGIVLGVGEHTGRGGIAGHFGYGAAGDDRGYLDQYVLTREVSAVTAACMALRRDVFCSVGGFDAEHLPIAYNDVDLCLRIRERGLRVVWTPFAELFHLESQSRGKDLTAEQAARALREAEYMRDRWDDALDHDRFYNPNFDLLDPMRGLARPPRRPKPWRLGNSQDLPV